MSHGLSNTLAERVANRMRRDGWEECDDRDVQLVWNCGTHTNTGLASAILQEFDELGLEPGGDPE